MDKQQAAKEYATKRYGNPDQDIAKLGWHNDGFLDFSAGWEAHEAQSPTDAVGTLCQHCDGDGFTKVDARQPDGTFQIDCEVCNATGKLFNPSGAVPQTAAEKEIYGNKAIDDIIATQKEWEEANSKPAAPQAAGPVWVNLAENEPFDAGDVPWRIIDMSAHSEIENKYFVWTDKTPVDTSYGAVKIEGEWVLYSNIEWLDESGQQVFTREQVEGAIVGFLKEKFKPVDADTAALFDKDAEEYMNTNYPQP